MPTTSRSRRRTLKSSTTSGKARLARLASRPMAGDADVGGVAAAADGAASSTTTPRPAEGRRRGRWPRTRSSSRTRSRRCRSTRPSGRSGTTSLASTHAADHRAAVSTGEEEEYEDEPEIPEYLLAERRQRAGAARPAACARAVNRRGGYQSAVDRERYGRSGTSSLAVAVAATGSTDLARRRNRGPRPQQPRPSRPAYQEPMREQERPMSASSEPWSEVPPEVQELLRAELARRQGQGTAQTAPRAEVGSQAVKAPSEVRSTAGRGRSRTGATSAPIVHDDDPDRVGRSTGCRSLRSCACDAKSVAEGGGTPSQRSRQQRPRRPHRGRGHAARRPRRRSLPRPNRRCLRHRPRRRLQRQRRRLRPLESARRAARQPRSQRPARSSPARRKRPLHVDGARAEPPLRRLTRRADPADPQEQPPGPGDGDGNVADARPWNGRRLGGSLDPR